MFGTYSHFCWLYPLFFDDGPMGHLTCQIWWTFGVIVLHVYNTHILFHIYIHIYTYICIYNMYVQTHTPTHNIYDGISQSQSIYVNFTLVHGGPLLKGIRFPGVCESTGQFQDTAERLDSDGQEWRSSWTRNGIHLRWRAGTVEMWQPFLASSVLGEWLSAFTCVWNYSYV